MTTSTNAESEEIEGVEDSPSGSWVDFPIDNLRIRQDTRAVHEVVRKIQRNAFVMDPDFQRDFIWDQVKQSRLIESVVMRIPLPVFYLAEDDQGRLVVVDGLQRLTTFRRYIKNEFSLRLKDQPELNNKKFEDLPPKLQNRIDDCNLILYVIDAEVSEQARLDIFERVNGGIPLSRQQMRNCLYMGDATLFLKNEARTEAFLKATGCSLQTKKMRDQEFVNRFCAFKVLDLETYRDMDSFLADCLRKMNTLPESLPNLSLQLRIALDNNFNLFGKHAFRKHTPGQEIRNVLNASLWDVMSTGLSRYPQRVVEEKATALREAYFRLMENEEFMDAITRGTNDVNRVKLRFALAAEMFGEVFGAYST